jgi:signal transduction histidine kinase
LAVAKAEVIFLRDLAYANAIWWPSGVGVAAVFFWGWRALPGVALGDYLFVLSTDAPWWHGLVTGTGNVAESWLAGTLLRRLGFDLRLERVRDVLALALAALVGPVGYVSTLLASDLVGRLPEGLSPANGLMWWACDGLGLLFVAAVAFPWLGGRPRDAPRPHRAELAAVLLALAGVTYLAFTGLVGPNWRPALIPLVYPLLVWSALRFGPRWTGAALAVHVSVVMIVLWQGEKAFGMPEPGRRGFPYLHAYLALTGLATLLLAAAVAERRRAEQALWAAQKLESLGALSGGIAHEFNNLMMVVLGNADLLKDAPGLPPDAAGSVAAIEQAAGRAAELTQAMLAYAGKGAFRRQPVCLSAVVREELDKVQPLVPPGVELAADLAPDLPALTADPGQVALAVVGVLRNAAEAHAGRPGTIRVTTGPYTLTAAEAEARPPAKPGPAVRVAVADGGCGMTAEVAGKMFDPFFSTKFAGRGLGLAATLGVVRAAGGLIRVHTRENVGTTVELVFPVPAAGPD